MSDNILITTVVSLDCDGGYNQKVIHLVQGDYGARALRLVPVSNGELIKFSNFVTAKVLMSCAGHENLLIDCEMADYYAILVPTAAMVSSADEWDCQLQLTKANASVTSAPFTINVHGTVYNGDAVEHTDNRVIGARYDSSGDLNIMMSSGENVKAQNKATLYGWIEYELDRNDKLITNADRAALDNIGDNMDQAVKTTSSPTFAGATIGGVTIDSEGNISGARFT